MPTSILAKTGQKPVVYRHTIVTIFVMTDIHEALVSTVGAKLRRHNVVINIDTLISLLHVIVYYTCELSKLTQDIAADMKKQSSAQSIRVKEMIGPVRRRWRSAASQQTRMPGTWRYFYPDRRLRPRLFARTHERGEYHADTLYLFDPTFPHAIERRLTSGVLFTGRNKP